MKNKITTFMKKESVLVIASVLAVISCFIVKPDAEYADYVDIRVLSLLFSLMAVMAGLRELYVFRRIGRALLDKTGSTRSLAAVLIFLCFFSSMLVTNDVALITFVPFAVEVLVMSDRKNLLIPVIVLQTIAANLGSMLTPPGNPQNLYIYSISGMGVWEFMKIMLPFTVVSGIMLVISLFFIGNEKLTGTAEHEQYPELNRRKLIMYIVLLIVCLLAVLRIIPHYAALAAVLAALLATDRGVLKRVDYFLLLTFISLFVLVENLARIDCIYNFISALTDYSAFAVSVGASQVISNVPAALLISGFTDNYAAVLKGVNVGGLGTIIASMASLISFKLYAAEDSKDTDKLRYMAVFTALNLLFLAVLCIVEIIMN